MSLKKKLRKHFGQLRSQIKIDEREKAAIAAAKHFAEMEVFLTSSNIACYLPFRDEFNSLPLIEKIWQAQKTCYLPILTDDNTLLFARYQYGDAFIRNRYDILEPKNIKQQIAAHNLDMVITPLVAFDLNGARLGTGGGYYDRTFAFLKVHEQQKESSLKPHLVGLAYAIQETAETLPLDPWDIKLEAIITEKSVIWVRP